MSKLPTDISIITTYRCPMRCQMCNIWQNPTKKEEEITAKVFEEHADEIFEEAENRLHAQKAILVKLMQDK